MTSAIAISEPGAGGDPAGMKTRAVLEGGQWVINGRKIWISNARHADFIIVMARVGDGQRRGGITSFIVEKGTPGFIIEREIPMVGGAAPMRSCSTTAASRRTPCSAWSGRAMRRCSSAC